MMTVILCLLPLPSDTQWWSIANLHDPRVTRTSSNSPPDSVGLVSGLDSIRIWCAGVVASNLATCPNSIWRLLIIVSVMFGRPIWTATSEFLTWSFHLTPRIWRWQLIWKDWSLRLSSASSVPIGWLKSKLVQKWEDYHRFTLNTALTQTYLEHSVGLIKLLQLHDKLVDQRVSRQQIVQSAVNHKPNIINFTQMGK